MGRAEYIIETEEPSVWLNTKERIVRCRDCKHFKLRVVEDDSKAGINLFGSCERLRACGRIFGMYQNDFCSRGERRE